MQASSGEILPYLIKSVGNIGVCVNFLIVNVEPYLEISLPRVTFSLLPSGREPSTIGLANVKDFPHLS